MIAVKTAMGHCIYSSGVSEVNYFRDRRKPLKHSNAWIGMYFQLQTCVSDPVSRLSWHLLGSKGSLNHALFVSTSWGSKQTVPDEHPIPDLFWWKVYVALNVNAVNPLGTGSPIPSLPSSNIVPRLAGRWKSLGTSCLSSSKFGSHQWMY